MSRDSEKVPHSTLWHPSGACVLAMHLYCQPNRTEPVPNKIEYQFLLFISCQVNWRKFLFLILFKNMPRLVYFHWMIPIFVTAFLSIVPLSNLKYSFLTAFILQETKFCFKLRWNLNILKVIAVPELNTQCILLYQWFASTIQLFKLAGHFIMKCQQHLKPITCN